MSVRLETINIEIKGKQEHMDNITPKIKEAKETLSSLKLSGSSKEEIMPVMAQLDSLFKLKDKAKSEWYWLLAERREELSRIKREGK